MLNYQIFRVESNEKKMRIIWTWEYTVLMLAIAEIGLKRLSAKLKDIIINAIRKEQEYVTATALISVLTRVI